MGSRLYHKLSLWAQRKRPAAIRAEDSHKVKDHPHGPIGTIVDGFASYVTFQRQYLSRRKRWYAKLDPQHYKIAKQIGYADKLESVDRLIDKNGIITDLITDYGRETYGIPLESPRNQADIDHSPVTDTLVHFVRDWSDAGRNERDILYPPILKALIKEFPLGGERKKMLVPGAGLGRLAHDISIKQGFEVDTIDYDLHTALAYEWLVNTATAPNQFTIYPWLEAWSHQSSTTDMLRGVSFPDVLPQNPNVTFIHGNFLKQTTTEGSYEAVVTLFFIDTARDIIAYLEHIHKLLKPGGIWINLGPIKWGTAAKIQLSLEEILQLTRIVGFEVDMSSLTSIDSTYAQQHESLLKYVYVNQFWVARKTT